MENLACLLFTCLTFFTIRNSEAFLNVPQTTSGCPYVTCPSCSSNGANGYSYRYDWRGCRECYCVYTTTPYVQSTKYCPYSTCPTCDYYHYQNYRTDWRGCQECYCEVMNTTPPPYVGTTDSSLQPHPASYWSMSRSSLLSILLNLKQEAQSLLDNARNTYDHILHSVIVNDLKKRREAVKEEEIKDQVDNKQT